MSIDKTTKSFAFSNCYGKFFVLMKRMIFKKKFQTQNQPCSCGELHDKCGPKLHSK